MMNEWQLQDAKNRFSEVVNLAISAGPQLVTRRGERAAVVLSYADYERLCKTHGRLSDFLRDSPLGEVEVSRDHTPPQGTLSS